MPRLSRRQKRITAGAIGNGQKFGLDAVAEFIGELFEGGQKKHRRKYPNVIDDNPPF